MSPKSPLQHRESWRQHRSKLERDKSKSNITRFFGRRRWLFFTACLKLFGGCVAMTGLYWRGNRNAKLLTLNRFDMEIKGLPKDFHGFEIVHISDIHFDRIKGIEKCIIDLLKDLTPDLIVMTGDYKDQMNLPAKHFESIFKELGKSFKAKHGVYAILGNHDTHCLVPLMEENGISVLINESVEIKQGESRITLTGVDDIHYFYTPDVLRALDEAPSNTCKILLVHSPEMVKEAEAKNYSLYLTGHTHSGQISLPGGKAIITHLETGKEFSVGRWIYKNMQGYTSSGAGVSGLTLRFFTKPEIAIIRLS